MDRKDIVFAIQENRDLFKSEILIGKDLKLKNYKELFKNKELIKILNNESINETINAFTKGNLNLTEASTNSYVHRNTLIYRINKVKKSIGLDFRKFEDCVIYLNMLEIYKMVNKKWCLEIPLNY